ncbi:MAG TPA: glycosyl transferase family protein [Dongiaceae bacterium]|jgi:anthranilate phosphoribosyltransferase
MTIITQAKPETRAVRPAEGTEAAPAPPAHPFAEVIRTIGRGTTLSRPLTESESEAAMEMILAGKVEPVQLGAFLLLLRYRGETPPELAGFVRATRRNLRELPNAEADLDWPSYADRHKQLPYFLLSALLLAANGVRIVLHGIDGVGEATTPKALHALGVTPSAGAAAAEAQLRDRRLTYLPLRSICPPMQRLFDLRPILGVRSPANSLCRELNPMGAPHQLQGVFHPTYLPSHSETARLLGQPHAAIFKGGGGEIQRNPEKACRVATVDDGVIAEENWDAITPAERYPWREEPADPQRLAGLWRGDWSAPGPEAAIIGTAAIALKLLRRAQTQADATELARQMWRDRPKQTHGR